MHSDEERIARLELIVKAIIDGDRRNVREPRDSPTDELLTFSDHIAKEHKSRSVKL